MRSGNLFAIVAAVASFGLVHVAEAQVKLRLGHVTSIDAIAGQGSTEFARTAEELSNGEIEVEIFPNSQLGGELEMVSQVRLGTLDMAMVGSGLAAAIEPTFSVTELPFIWKDSESAWEVLNGEIGQRILGMLEPKGIKGLSWGVWGDRGFLMTSPVESLEDMKGKKIRIVENPLYVSTVRALDANPVPMAWPEVYSGLQQNTIDGVETNYHGMADAKLYEVAKHLLVSDHIFTPTVYMMNLDTFNSLSPEHQEVIMKAAEAAGEAMYTGAKKANEEGIALMERNGITVVRPDQKPFVEAIQPVHDQFSAQIGQDLIEDVKEAQQ